MISFPILRAALPPFGGERLEGSLLAGNQSY